MTEHVGHEKDGRRCQRSAESRNVPQRDRPKTVLTVATGQVQIDVPGDRAGTFEPQIVKKRQRRLTRGTTDQRQTSPICVTASLRDHAVAAVLRRLGDRSPSPCPLLSLMLATDVARDHALAASPSDLMEMVVTRLAHRSGSAADRWHRT